MRILYYISVFNATFFHNLNINFIFFGRFCVESRVYRTILRNFWKKYLLIRQSIFKSRNNWNIYFDKNISLENVYLSLSLKLKNINMDIYFLNIVFTNVLTIFYNTKLNYFIEIKFSYHSNIEQSLGWSFERNKM